LLALLVVALPALANYVHVTAGGYFDATVPLTFFSAPNAPWGLQFDIGIYGFTAISPDANGFSVPWDNFRYTVSGVQVPASGPDTIRFYTFDYDGLFDVQGQSNPMSDWFTIALFGDQAFSGSTDSPTILPGHYPVTGGGFMLNGNPSFQDPAGSWVDIVEIVPEPSSLLMAATSLLLSIGCAGWAGGPPGVINS
jgi:hypothetical protein